MKRQDRIEMLTRNYYKRLLADYIAYQIMLDHIYYGNDKADSYSACYNSSWDQINYNNEEQEEIFRMVDDILEQQYGYIQAHYDKNLPIYLVDISGKEEM